MSIAASVLTGWIADDPWLKGAWKPGMTPMSPTNALLFVISGAAVATASLDRSKPRWGVVAAGIVVALAAALSLAGADLRVHFSLDHLVFASAVRPDNATSFGMRYTIPVGFVGLGAALSLLALNNPSRWPMAQFLVMPALLLGFFAAIGHLYGAITGSGALSPFPMSMAAAICLMVTSCGLLMLRPGIGLMGILSAPNLGGAMARRLFPVMLIVPPILGLAMLSLTRASLIDMTNATAALVTLTGPVFAVAILVSSRRLESTSVALLERSREVETAREAAEDANRAKSAFLANMSHELRTPLNAIIGFSEILRDSAFGPLSERYREYAGDIFDSGSHLLAVVNQILDLAKVEARKLDLIEDRISLKELGETCLVVVRERAMKDRVDLRCEVAEDYPDIIADEIRMKQILLNLLSNAVKFNVPGGGVMLGARIAQDGGAEIRVSDTGIGMNAEELAAAFIPFRQSSGGLARRYEGTGLGLPLARALVESHGGSLEVESARGAGTTAIIRLPAERVARTPV